MVPIGREKMSFLGERNEEGQGILIGVVGVAGRQWSSRNPEGKLPGGFCHGYRRQVMRGRRRWGYGPDDVPNMAQGLS